MVKLSSNVSDGKADNAKNRDNSIYSDLLSHRDIVCLPQLRSGGTLIHEYAACLSWTLLSQPL